MVISSVSQGPCRQLDVFYSPEVETSPLGERGKGTHKYLRGNEETNCMSCGNDAKDGGVPMYFRSARKNIALERVVPIIVVPIDVRARC